MELKKEVPYSYKILQIKLNKKGLTLAWKGYFINPHNHRLEDPKLLVTDHIRLPIELYEKAGKLKKWKALFVPTTQIKIPISKILEDETRINNHLRIELKVDGQMISHYLGKPISKNKLKKWNQKEGNPEKRRKGLSLLKAERLYILPIRSCFAGSFALHIRRGLKGMLVLVKRPMDPYERTRSYRFYESRLVSGCMYLWGRVKKTCSKKSVNLYYEKYAGKAEEGTLELQQAAWMEKGGGNYFILDPASSDYERIKDLPGVVAKYSKEYYKLLYRANHLIATEAPAHLSVLRTNNPVLRRLLMEDYFVFLQHGVTYLKPHDKQSSFVTGRDAQLDAILVNGPREAETCREMFRLSKDQVWQTGMVIFDKIKYQSITQTSQNIVTIMLTWKPYEEQLLDFSKSQYYKEILALYDLLKGQIRQECIRIVAHPKVAEALDQTPFAKNLYQGKIFDLLDQTKLLITDYSSVCYQSYYRGAGVIFYQYDLEKFEETCGKLLPKEEEYIGPRVFTMEELKLQLESVILDGEINLSKLRGKQEDQAFLQVVSDHDTGRKDRLIERLKIEKLL